MNYFTIDALPFWRLINSFFKIFSNILTNFRLISCLKKFIFRNARVENITILKILHNTEFITVLQRRQQKALYEPEQFLSVRMRENSAKQSSFKSVFKNSKGMVIGGTYLPSVIFLSAVACCLVGTLGLLIIYKLYYLYENQLTRLIANQSRRLTT